MTIEQFSDAFDTLLNSYHTIPNTGELNAKVDITLDELEKSIFLTQALEEVVINLYNGKNPYGDSFESTEELRRYLDILVKTKLYNKQDLVAFENPVSTNSIFFKLPDDIAFITYEQVTFGDDSLGCYNGKVVDVYPVTLDEYNRISRNPFRGATKRRVLRMDTGNNTVELISKYNIGKYLIKYLAKPEPIRLVSLDGKSAQGCKLNEVLHYTILKRAVQLAILSRQASIRVNGEQ